VIGAHLAPEAAGLAEAMALGMRGSLAPETIAGFRHLGWQHLIAVSGMNVGFVLGLALAILHFARVREVSIPLLLMVLLYTILTGSEPPVVRATIMACLGFLARACNRTLPTGRALVVAALGGLAVAPRWLGDPSFQLSFAALAGMALLGPPIDWANPLAVFAGRGLLAKALVLPLWSGFAAQLGCLPILATTFHWLSPWGLLTGPVAIPHAALLVAAVLLGLAMVGCGLGPIGHLSLGGAGVVTEALLSVERLGVRHLPPPWPMSAPGSMLTVVFVAAVACLPLFRRRRRWRILPLLVGGAAGVVMITGLPPATGPPERVEVIFLDVGQGDAAIVLAKGAGGWPERLGCRRRPQYVLVIDTGDRPSAAFDAGTAVVAQALAAAGARVIDSVILSHGDRDHLGGLEGLARSLPVREIVWPRPLAKPAPVERLTSEGPNAGYRGAGGQGHVGRSTLRLAGRGDTVLARPGLVAVAFHPPLEHAGSGNDGSLVVRLEALGGRVLFTGDVETSGESILCDDGQDLAADIVKVPHHGSRTSSTPRLVSATGASHAVVSVGATNRFGHPDPGVLERWQAGGAQIWRTDVCGAITAVLEQGGIEVHPMVIELQAGRPSTRRDNSGSAAMRAR
jgi:competence protein ComEC